MIKISQVKEEFMGSGRDTWPSLIEKYGNDERIGVKNLVSKYIKELQKYSDEVSRSYEMFRYEREYCECEYICGIDEVGRGPLAGPVVACAVVLPKDCDILYLNDSKKVSENKREELYVEIMEKAISVGIGIISPYRIDEINILNATYEAMGIAIEELSVKPEVFLNDAVTIPGVEGKQVAIIKGDTKSATIAAASIVAKVTRDRLMVEYDEVLEGYGFAKNKGYGSEQHIQALNKLGPTPIHRYSFIKNFI